MIPFPSFPDEIQFLMNCKSVCLLLLLSLALLLIPITCPCPSSQYQANGVCYNCHDTCKTCTSSTTTSCVTCDSTRYLTSYNSCQCNDGYVENNPVVGQCQSLNCHYSCVTCNNTANTCTSCNTAHKRVLVSGTSTCPCIEQYYDTGSSSSCSACHYSCTTCSGSTSTQCLTCNGPIAHRSLSSTSCPCQLKFYDINNVYICGTCNYKCAQCQGSATNCTVCGSNRATIPTCLCSVGFYDDAVSEACIACHYSCKDCLNGTSCSVCDATKFRVTDAISPFCSCQVKYYDNGVELCVACNPTCLTCSSTNVCLTCNTTALRIFQPSTKTCLCATGYYATSATVELCVGCDSRCLTCAVATTNCTACDPTKNRVLTSNSCPCKAGLYQNAFIMCAACHTYCNTCTNSSECVDCIPSTLMTMNSSNLCSCPAGTFYNSTTLVCEGCHHSCATCQTTSPVLCVTCPSSTFRTFASDTCPCDQYYYNSGTSPICLRCHHSCQTCTAGTATTCLTCTDAAHRYLSGASCLCKALFYDNGSSQLCQPCMYNCLTCLDATSCSSCNTTLKRVLDTTVSPQTCRCMDYYFEKSLLCQPCLYSCLSCNTNTTCLTCESPTNFRVYNASTLLCDCMVGYYDNFVDRTCLACLPECLTCTNATKCTSCSAARNRVLSGTFRCPCKDQYFDVAGVCTGCSYSCSTCSSPSACSTCNSTALRKLDASSQCICADNYFDDGSNQLCLPCSYACLTCVTTAIQCVTCDTSQRIFSSGWCACAQRYYDNNSTVACVRCHYTCDSCLTGVTCATCNITKQRIFDSINQYCICSIGWYDDGMNEECLACNYRCATCTNSTQCLTCSAAWFRATPASLCPCAEGYYDDGSTPTCRPCHYTCKTCTNASQCLSCDLPTNKRVFDSSYLCKCIDRFFDDTLNNQLCQPCVYSCLTCVSSTSTCTTCNQTAMRVLTGTQCLCLQRWYDNLVELCLRCNYRCSTCVQASKCLTCNSTMMRLADSTNNLCKCDVLYWDDGANQTCSRCELTCYTCTDLTKCLTCNVTRNRLLNSTVDFFGVSSPFCVCLYRYYSPSPSADCLPCHYSCQVCTGGNRNNCAMCTTSLERTLNTTTTQCLCNAGFYDDNLTQPCQTCHPYCALCHTGLPNSCSKCNNPYYILASVTTCYLTCPDYYFDYQVNFTCMPCSLYCKTCVNASYCSSCQTPKLLWNNTCVLTCPAGTYAHSSGTVCLDCPKGCYNCSGNSLCYSCFSKFYFNPSLGFCFSCNSVCLNCTGPGQTDCTACQSPLIVYRGTCTVLDCQVGTYVQPDQGCVSCSSKFPGATLCNYTQPSKCSSNYIFNGSACLTCTQVTGYEVKSDGQCGQICGDGILIYLQCDDGNRLDGDGCSSKCTIEPGWNCSYTTGGSFCDLIQLPAMELVSTTKKFGVNFVTVVLALSRPVRVVVSKFTLAISGLTAIQYSFEVSQSSLNLSLITISISYSASLQQQTMTLSYTSTRRLQEQTQTNNYENYETAEEAYGNGQISQTRTQGQTIITQGQTRTQLQRGTQRQAITQRLSSAPRLLATITFSGSFSVSSYPPADYYPDSTLNSFQLIRNYINAFSVALVVLCFILIPKRMHLHAVTLIYVPAQIFISYGLVPASYTDWLQHTVQDTHTPALLGGFSFGHCCMDLNPDHSLTTQLTLNSGIVIVVLFCSWLLLLVLQYFHSKCYNIENKFKMVRHFVFSLHLLTLFSLAYTSMTALVFYQLKTNADVFNSILGIALTIFYIVAIISLWVRTYQMVPVQNSASTGRRKIYSEDKVNQKEVMVPIPMMSEEHTDKRVIRERDRSQDGAQDALELELESELQTKGRNGEKSSEGQSTVPQVENTEEQPLIWDYFSLYRHYHSDQLNPTKAKYFLPLLLTKLYLTAIFASFLTNHPFVYFICSSLLELLFLAFLIEVRPFESIFTNIRLMIVSLLFLAINIVCTIYLKFSLDNNYLFIYERIAVYLVLALTVLAVVFAVLQHILAWKRQIWKKVLEPCLKGTRLMGTRNVAVFEAEEADPMDRSTYKMTGSSFRTTRRAIDDNEQMDAFYARMLKKENLKKKYKRERMLK